MSDQAQPRAEIATRPVVYRMPCMDDVIVRRDLPYKSSLTMDVYYPPASKAQAPLPAVVFVMGYPDAGTRRIVGCSAKEMACFIDWAKLVATFGMVAITYAAAQPDVDVHDLLRHLRAQAQPLGIDVGRLGVWACSGHGPVALSLLMSGEPGLACAALIYPCLPELADASIWPRDLPLLLARAGRDEMPGLNAAIDAFVPRALGLNLPLTLINHHTAPHAFDIVDDTDASRQVVMRTLAFLQLHLRPAMMAVGQEKPGLHV
jgi:acetyl esterase/lipase